MNEKPILMNEQSVRAILDGRKVQTRRVMKQDVVTDAGIAGIIAGTEPAFDLSKCPYGIPGDHLWVRETWKLVLNDTDWCGIWYPATANRDLTPLPVKLSWERKKSLAVLRTVGLKPSIHMPREFSRITLEITDVRVERVQEITLGDVAAEGWPDAPQGHDVWVAELPGLQRCGFDWWIKLWDSINGDHPWASNPWVWVIAFEAINE